MLDLNKRSLYVLVLLITLTGALLRFYKIDGKGLWLDEILALSDAVRSVQTSALAKEMILSPGPLFTENNATKDFREIWFSRGWEPHPPLYFLLLKIWILLLGASDTALRSLSAFFSVLAIPMGFLVARAVANVRAGLFLSDWLKFASIN